MTMRARSTGFTLGMATRVTVERLPLPSRRRALRTNSPPDMHDHAIVYSGSRHTALSQPAFE